MHKSFVTFASFFTLVFFLATPLSAFALTAQQTQQLATLLALQQSGAITPQDAQTLLLLQQLQNQQQPYYGAGQQGYGAGAAGNGLAQGLLLSSVLGGQGGLGGGAGGLSPATLGLAMMGGGGLGSGAGGGRALGGVSQALTLAGALTGNMGLLIAGMITSMIGGLAGGAGGTPQRGAVDEQYVAPGQAGPYGAGGYNPYYTTPTVPAAPSTPASSCDKTIFIVKNTTVTPNTVTPYPTAVEILQNQCVLAINSDTGASHSVQIKDQDTVKATQSIDKEKSHIFRFENKKAYTLCVDAGAAACTTVTVK